MNDYYTPKAVSEATGASASALRIYSDRYARHLSTEATEIPRKFTVADLKLIAFIIHCTKSRAMTHEQVEAVLQAGELETFTWEPPILPTGAASGPEAEQATALVPVAQLQALQVVLEETRRRERDAAAAAEAVRTEATQRTQVLQDEIAKLQNQLGQAQGELATYKTLRRRPPWWRWLFGGE